MTNPDHLPLSDDALLAKMGHSLSQKRVRARLTQQQLARQAGVGKRTVERLEAGLPTQLPSFLRILRALGLLSTLDVLTHESGATPMQLLRLKEDEPKRVRASSKKPEAKPWTWGDQP